MIEWVWLSDVSGWTVAAMLGILMVTLVLRGFLIPRRTYLDLKEERNTWRDVAQLRDKTIADQAEALHELRGVGRAAATIMQRLPLDDPEPEEAQ